MNNKLKTNNKTNNIEENQSKTKSNNVKASKDANLPPLINDEVNKHTPLKSKTDVELENALESKRQLELQIQFHSLLLENNFPLSAWEFVAGKDVDDTSKKIKRFKSLVMEIAEKHIQEWRNKLLSSACYTPPGDNGTGNSEKDIWEIMK